MSSHLDLIHIRLSAGPLSARQLIESIGISQPTLSRALTELGDEVVRIGAARSIQYTLRDSTRGLPDIPIYRVDEEGRIRQLGTLIPVRPEGFVMRQENGVALHSDGSPWWLLDMRPRATSVERTPLAMVLNLPCRSASPTGQTATPCAR